MPPSHLPTHAKVVPTVSFDPTTGVLGLPASLGRAIAGLQWQGPGMHGGIGGWRWVGNRVLTIPVGDRTVSVQSTGWGIPSVVTRSDGSQATILPAPIDRRDKSQDSGGVPNLWTKQGGRWTLTQPGMAPIRGLTESGARTIARERGIPGPRTATSPTPAAAAPPKVTPLPGPTLNGNPNVHIVPPDVARNSGIDRDQVRYMDLGNILGGIAQVGQTYANYRLQQSVLDAANPLSGFVDIPGIDIIGQNPGVDGCGNYVYKKVCGEYKWVKQRKRRRKRLATSSDIKDLSALSGVLGKGKLLETWIATHS